MINNKKAQTSMLRKIVIMILILIVLTIIFSNIMSGSNNSLKCTRNNGVCADSCDRFTQYQYLGGKAGGCKDEQLCCINMTQPKPVDSRCAKLEIGAECDDTLSLMYCDSANQCVSKCEYCSNNFIDKKNCADNIFENADKDNLKLSCACTPTTCEGKGDLGCIKGYCPNENTANGYSCCTVYK